MSAVFDDDVTQLQDVDLAPLEEMEALLEDIPSAKARIEFGEALENAYTLVKLNDALLERLDAAASCFDVCVEYLEPGKNVRRGLQHVQGIGRRLRQANQREHYAETRHEIRDLLRDVEALEQTMAQALLRLVQREFQSAGALGRVLARVTGTEELGQRMVDLGAAAARLEQCAGEEVRGEVARLREENKALREELGNLGADAEVVAFLQDIAQQGGVPLSRVKGSVFPWLEEHDALGLLSVSLKV